MFCKTFQKGEGKYGTASAHGKGTKLSALSMPTLVIAGTKDMIKDSHTRLIAKSIHEAALALVPGDHFIANKKADAFNREVESFLNKRL